MAKVLLIGPLTERYSGIEDYGAPPLGVHRIAAFLKAHGHAATVYDSNLQSPEWFDRALETQWDIIGISILAETLRLSLEMLLRLRRVQPRAVLVAGGPEAMVNYERIFEETPTNVAVIGDGELPMLELADGKRPSDAKGVVVRRFALPVTNDLLWSYYEHLNFAEMGWREYWAKNEAVGDRDGANRLVRIVTATHCNRQCIFCSVSRLRELACGRTVLPAFLSGDQVHTLIKRILDQLPETTHIYFIEDSFLPVRERMAGFCAALEPFKDRVKFLVQTDTNMVDRETIRRLAEVGVVHISFGVESCSARLRRWMGKPQTDQRLEDVIAWCNEFGVRCYYLVILFAPESTVEDLWSNYRTLTRWQDEGKVTVSIIPYMIPYRGTRIFSSDFQFGYQIERLSNGRSVKSGKVVYPKDPQVRAIMERFRAEAPGAVERFNREAGHGRKSKDYTGRVYIELLGKLLEEEETRKGSAP